MTATTAPIRIPVGLADRVRVAVRKQIARRASALRREYPIPTDETARLNGIEDIINAFTDDQIARLAPSGLAAAMSRYPGRNASIDEWQRFNDAFSPLLKTAAIDEWAGAVIAAATKEL